MESFTPGQLMIFWLIDDMIMCYYVLIKQVQVMISVVKPAVQKRSLLFII